MMSLNSFGVVIVSVIAAVSSFAIASERWEGRSPLPVPTGELMGAVWEGAPVVVGGLGPEWATSSRVFAYDPEADAWSALPDLPVPLNHHAAAAAGGTLYVMGGATDFGHDMVERPDVYALPPGAPAWEERAPMPESRWGHGAAAIDGKIYVVGGRRSEDRALMIYDPEADQWELGPELPTPRDHLGVVAQGGLLYTVGGRVGAQNVGTVEVFDPQTNGWTSAPVLPTPRSGMGVAVVADRIHTAGGEDLETGTVFDTHEAYDPAAEEWLTLHPLPQATHGPLGAAVGDGFMVVGGSSQAGGRSALGWLDRVDIFVPSGSE